MLLTDIAICIVVAWLLAIVAQLLKQPLILAYLLAGVAVGPVGIGWVQEQSAIETISGLGLILLLFMIGLEIDLKKILASGRIITLTAAAQIIGSFLLGLIIFWAAGFPIGKNRWDALYLAVALALSSTVIVVKILYDKRELDTLPGRVTLGILVLQDLFAILFLAIQPNLKDAGLAVLLMSLGKVTVLVAFAFVVSRFVLPALFRAVARLPELVLVGALAWCFLTAGLAQLLGLSREIGALVAGIALSTFPYTLDVAAKVTSLRDFFVTLFFVSLGMSIPAPSWSLAGWSLFFAGAILLTRIVTVFVPLYLLRQGHRAGLVSTINLAQVSELAMVILALGFRQQDISQETKALAGYAFVLLAVLSSYAILKSDPLARFLGGKIEQLGLPDLGASNEAVPVAQRSKIFLLGFSWTASSLLETLSRQQPLWLSEITVIDFNPHVNQELRARGIRVIYGDISQRDTLLHAGVAEAETIICTLPNTVLKGTSNLGLLRQVRSINPNGEIIMHAERLADVPVLYREGATYVFVPRLIEADELCGIIGAARQNLLEEKRAEMETRLGQRREVLP